MKTTYVVILSVLLLLSTACAQKVNDPADVQAIKKSMDDLTKAVNAWGRWCRCRVNDGQDSLSPPERTCCGRCGSNPVAMADAL